MVMTATPSPSTDPVGACQAADLARVENDWEFSGTQVPIGASVYGFLTISTLSDSHIPTPGEPDLLWPERPNEPACEGSNDARFSPVHAHTALMRR